MPLAKIKAKIMDNKETISTFENELILMRATIQAYIETSMPTDEWMKVRDLAKVKYEAFFKEAIERQNSAS